MLPPPIPQTSKRDVSEVIRLFEEFVSTVFSGGLRGGALLVDSELKVQVLC